MQELNIGGSLVASAVEEACGTSRLKVREMYNDLGDLGRDLSYCNLLIYSLRLFHLSKCLLCLKVMLLKHSDKHRRYLPLLRRFS